MIFSRCLQYVVLSLVLAAPAAFAQGDRAGGGGDIVSCPEYKEEANFWQRITGRDKVLHWFLYDVYESGKTGNRWPNLGGPNIPIRDKINLIVDDFAKLDPVRAKNYGEETHKIWDDLEIQEKFLKESRSHSRNSSEGVRKKGSGFAMLLDTRIKDIDDTDEKFDFRPCNKYQLVRQEAPVNHLAQQWYEFDERYWMKLDSDNKVATLFHEAIYRELREFNAPDSRPTRNFNSYLYSRTTHLLTIPQYLAFLSSNNLPPRTMEQKKRAAENPPQQMDYHFRSNIGLVRIYNVIPGVNKWSATLTDDGLITNVSFADSKVDLNVIGLGLLAPQVISLKFDLNRNLTGLNGFFSFSYDPVSKKIYDFNAKCDRVTPACIQSDFIEIDSKIGWMRISGTTDSFWFDRDGNIQY